MVKIRSIIIKIKVIDGGINQCNGDQGTLWNIKDNLAFFGFEWGFYLTSQECISMFFFKEIAGGRKKMRYLINPTIF